MEKRGDMTQHEAKMIRQQYAGPLASVLQQAKQERRADLQRASDELCKALSDYQLGSDAIWCS